MHPESFREIWMNVVLAKQLHDAYEFVVMHLSYEMVLTMQLVHLNCRKGRVQPPTRKGGRDLFQRTSDDNSRFTPINMNLKLPWSETP